MHKHARLALAFSAVLVVAACGEVPTATAPEAAPVTLNRSSAKVVPGTCTNLTQLNNLAAVLFTPGSSPNINSVKGKLKNLDGLVKKGKFADAKAAAGEIVAFTLKKHNQGGLSGTADQVEQFTNAVLCFAGIDIDVEEPTNSYFILPSDQPQVIKNIEGTAGISFPANPVSEPTLIEFVAIPDSFPGNSGPLTTKLDQYPGFVHIEKTSEGNAPLAHPAVVAICADGVIPQSIRNRLRLGHNATAGFEITPAASGDFITCPNQVAEATQPSLLGRVAQLFLPKEAHAATMMFEGGGVGGTVTEFSPFAPVDPQLEFGGGVGGTVTEFSRALFSANKLGDAATTLAADCSTATVNTLVGSECAPFVLVRTHLGTVLTGVPVQWFVTSGNGSVAANGGSCGTFGNSAAGASDVNGRAAACWRLGTTAGVNGLRAVPGAGGDAPAGVTFVPAQFDFSMTGTADAPTQLVILQGTLQFDVPLGVVPIRPTVKLMDQYGNPVAGRTVTWQTFEASGGGMGIANPAASVTDANGEASTEWTIGLSYNQMWAIVQLEGEAKLKVNFIARTDH